VHYDKKFVEIPNPLPARDVVLPAVPTSSYEVAMTIYRRVALALWLSAIGLLTGPNFIATAFAADPWGIWYTKDNESQIRITNCGGALCGSLVWLQEPNDPTTGEPLTDKHNPDPSKQSQPLLGTRIVLGMRPSGPDQWSGELYNAGDGKTYTGSFTMTGANTAEIQGCLLVFCQSQTWTRAK
jgi:uncharacterized protein (DUF2147 family)